MQKYELFFIIRCSLKQALKLFNPPIYSLARLLAVVLCGFSTHGKPPLIFPPPSTAIRFTTNSVARISMAAGKAIELLPIHIYMIFPPFLAFFVHNHLILDDAKLALNLEITLTINTELITIFAE